MVLMFVAGALILRPVASEVAPWCPMQRSRDGQ